MNIYLGIDLAQVIIALLFLLIFIIFFVWGWRVMHQRVMYIEQSVGRIHDHVFRDIESEDFEEEPDIEENLTLQPGFVIFTGRVADVL